MNASTIQFIHDPTPDQLAPLFEGEGRRHVVYVAGPMRKIPEFNFPAFKVAADALRQLGYAVISPAEHDLEHGFDPTGMDGTEDLGHLNFNLRSALAWDLDQVTKADAICLLDGWEDSSGARAELAAAAAIGLKAGELFDFHSRDFDDLPDAVDMVRVAETCPNCDGRKCMSCVFREIHDVCLEDCPACTPAPPTVGERVVDLLRPPLVGKGEVRITSSTGGQKGRKLARFDLLPADALWQVAEHYGKGAQKYTKRDQNGVVIEAGDRNWERGYDWSLSFGAMMRHAWAFWNGEDIDEETGSSHLAAIVFHALGLLTFAKTHPELDDRPAVTR